MGIIKSSKSNNSDITDSPEYGQSAPGTFSSSYNSYDSENDDQVDTE